MGHYSLGEADRNIDRGQRGDLFYAVGEAVGLSGAGWARNQMGRNPCHRRRIERLIAKVEQMIFYFVAGHTAFLPA
jgi:hypothetical protein